MAYMMMLTSVCMNTKAEISFVDMKGVDACIKEQQDKNKPDPKAYSPWQGFVALKSDYIQNIRFFGNLDFVYKKGEGDENPSRLYKEDQGRDPLNTPDKGIFYLQRRWYFKSRSL